MYNGSYPPSGQYPAQRYNQTQGQSSQPSQVVNAWPNNNAQGSGWPGHPPAEPLSSTLNRYQHLIPRGMPPVRSAHATEAYSLAHQNNPDPLRALASMPNQFFDMYNETSATGANVQTQMPAVYSVAFTKDPSYLAHYGTSGPNKSSSKSDQELRQDLLAHRAEDAYNNLGIGEPRKLQRWAPGQCAETQSLPPIVRHACEHIKRGGNSVQIYSYAIKQDGTKKAMCKNCVDLTERLQRQYPGLTIVDGAEQFQGRYPKDWSAPNAYGPQ